VSAAGWWREAEDLDDEQQRVAALPRDGKYLVTGKPGSGKTNLLVLRAAYLIRAKQPNIKVLTWTRLINEFIASGSASHGLTTGDELQTFRSWAKFALSELEMDIVPTGTFAQQVRQLTDALLAAEDELSTYDGMLLDEVQDYSAELINLFSGLSDRLFYVGDENQRIYDAKGGMNAARAATQEEFVLPYHYRNGLQICRVAEVIHGETDYAETSRYDEERLPSRVHLREYDDLEDQVRAVASELLDQLRSYPNELLGVMVPLTVDLKDVIDLLRENDAIEPYCQFQTAAEFYSPLDEDKPIVVSTINAAKGVEYRAAHIVAMDGIRRFPVAKRHNLTYTAVTRAKTTLHGYYSGNLLPWIQSAFLKGEEPPDEPTLADLFSP
jgi:superfamily I DNA/RNA helicase